MAVAPAPHHPRSTPIPGAGDPFAGDPSLPGNAPAAPPTSAEFLSAAGAPGAPTASPFAARSPLAPPPSMDPTHPMAAAVAAAYDPAAVFGYGTRRRRSGWRALIWLVVMIGPITGAAIGVWAFFEARDAIRAADDLSDPTLSDEDREALGLADDVTTLFQAPATAAVVQAIDDAVGSGPDRFTEILVYPDYAFGTAQDPAIPTNVDEYSWRSGEVGVPSAEQNVDDLESKLFAASDVNWAAVSVLAEQAPLLTGVQSGTVTHIVVGSSVFADGAVQVSIYVNGPRDSGFVQANALGEITAIY